MATRPDSPFEPFERMVTIRLLGREVEVPDNNTLLRGLSYLFPTDVTGGKFCWNGECNNSKFYFRLPGEDVDRKARMCRYKPREGMEITLVSAELKYVLRRLLRDGDGAEDSDEAPVRRSAAGE